MGKTHKIFTRMTRLARVAVVGLAGVQGFSTTPHTDPCADFDSSREIVFAVEPDWGDWSTCFIEGQEINPDLPYDHYNLGMNHKCTGIVTQVYSHICEQAGLTCSHNVVRWADVWSAGKMGQGFEQGSFHVAAAARITKPRLDQCMVYSNPYTSAKDGYLVANEMFEGKVVTACAKNGDAIGGNQLRDNVARWAADGYTVTVDDSIGSNEEVLRKVKENDGCQFALFDGMPDMTGLVEVERIPVATASAHGGAAFMMDGHNPDSHCILEKLNEAIHLAKSISILTELIEAYPTIDRPETLMATHTNDNANCAHLAP